jgi:CHASE2 domain-containing sensor protein/class 3 adenylate cyclase
LQLDKQLRSYLAVNQPVRICLRSSNRQIQRLPWHLWDIMDRYLQAEIALNAPTFHGLAPAPATRPRRQDNRVQILAILGHCEGIDVEADRQELQNLPDARVCLLDAPTRQAVTEALQAQPWDMLFFAGHSQTSQERGQIDLNPHDSLSLADLKYALREAIQRGLQLAIFNSCDGLGLAWALEELSLPHLIVMREPVPDAIAQAFLKGFLRSFSQGKTLYQSVRQARENLQGLEDQFPCASWLPMICQHPAARPPTWQSLKQPPPPATRLVTLVFTDLVNSTGVKHHLPGTDINSRNRCYVETILTPHRQRVTAHLAEYGGSLVKTEGDGHFLSFADVLQAARWASALQLSHRQTPIATPLGPLQVRIGLHTGTPLADTADQQDFVGQQVDFAARLTDLAQGGQILLSEVSAALIRSAALSELEVVSHGVFPLKGLGHSPIWELLYPGKAPQPPRPSPRQPSRWAIALTASLVATLLVAGMRLLGWLQPVELKAYDQLMRWRPSESLDSRLLLIEATEADVNRYGFPLPDGILADVIDELNLHSPRIIGLDIFRPGPVPPGHDRLSQQFERQSHLIGLCSVGQPDNPNFPGIKPPPSLPQNRQGFSELWEDVDGILRRQVLFSHSDYDVACSTPFSLGALVALQYLEAQGIQAETLSHNEIQIGSVSLPRLQANAGGYHNLDNRGFQVMLNYRMNAQVAQTLSLSEVLAGQVDPAWVKDRVVLIGVTAPTSNATDYFWTPLSAGQWPHQTTAGTAIQAQMVSQILSAVLDNRPLIRPLPTSLGVLWLGGWGLLGSLIALYTRRTWVNGGLLVLEGSLLWSCSLLLLGQGWWVPLVPAAIAACGGNGLVLGYRVWQPKLNSRRPVRLT